MDTERYRVAKFVATGLGLALCGVEAWLNAEHVAQIEGWASSLVAATIVASIGAAASLPLAERAAKSSQPAKAAGLAIFFILMVGFSFTASVARVGGKHDGEVTAARGSNSRASLAQEAYDAAKQTVKAECATKRGPRCRAAEQALADTRKVLQTAPAPVVEDSMARRIAAVLPVTEGQVELYQPLILPLGLQIGGFILLALGLAPGKPQSIAQQPPAQEAAPISISGEEAAHRWMIDRILAAPGRKLTASGRELATLAGVAPATFAKWRNRWVAEGKIVAVRSGSRTSFTLLKLRQVA